MESDSKEDVLMPEVKHYPHSIKSIELCNEQKNPVGKNTERKPIDIVLMCSDKVKESVKPIEMNLVDDTFYERPVPHKQAKFSFGWKKTSGKIVSAKVHTVNENTANKSVQLIEKVPNIVHKNLFREFLKEKLRNDRSETQRISNVEISSNSKKDTQNHNLETASTPSFKPSFELQTGQTDALLDLHSHNCNFTHKVKTPEEDEPNPTVENCFKIPPTYLDYLPSQVLDSSSTSTPHSLDSSSTSTPHSSYPFPEHHPVISSSANVLENPLAAIEAAMEELDSEELDRKKKKRKLKERRRASPEPDSRKRKSRSPHRRERHHKHVHGRRHYSPLRKRSRHSKHRHRSPSHRHSTHNSDSRSPPPKRSKILDLRDNINSRSPSPKTSVIGDLRDKIISRSPSPEKSKIYLRNKNSGGARKKKKKKVTKLRTLSPVDYSKLDDNQSQNLIKSKLTKLSVGSLKSLRTSILNELLEESQIDLLDGPNTPIQSAESNPKSLPSNVSVNPFKENDMIQLSESVACVKETSEKCQASIPPVEAQLKESSVEFYFHSSILPVDTHLTDFLIQEKFTKRSLSILPVGQPFKVSPVMLDENETSKYGETFLHQQTGESIHPILSAQLKEKSSNICCSKVPEGKNSSELSQQILDDKINFSLTPFLKLEWQIKKISDVFDEDNSSLSEQSDKTFSPIVKLDWKLEYQEMNITSELKEPIPRGKDDKNLSPVSWHKAQLSPLPLPIPCSNVVNTSSASEAREPLTSGPSLIRESYSTIPPLMSVSVGSLPNPQVPVGSLINPNILNCGVCEKTCKRSVVLPCCLAQACNGCAVSAITKSRKCWGCQKPVKSTKELSQDKVLREAIEWFRKNGTIKREHGESLILRRKFIIERKEKFSKVKKKTNKVANLRDALWPRGKNKRTKAKSISNYARGRKRRDEKDKSGYKTPEKSKKEKRRSGNSRMSGDNDKDRNESRRKQKLPDDTKSLTKMSKNSTDPEEVSVITRVKRKLLERIESLQNDQEKLCLAKSEFQNPICSDPTLNLTFHGYKRRKLLVMQDESVDSFYDFYENPEVVKVGHVQSEERQMFYLKAGDTVSMPGFKKVFKMDKVEDNVHEEEIKEIVRAEEFKVLLENEFQKNNKPLKKSKRSSKKDEFKIRFSHFQAVHSEAINFLQFYKSELERRQVEEIVYLENLYKKCAVFYGKTDPIFCKVDNNNVGDVNENLGTAIKCVDKKKDYPSLQESFLLSHMESGGVELGASPETQCRNENRVLRRKGDSREVSCSDRRMIDINKDESKEDVINENHRDLKTQRSSHDVYNDAGTIKIRVANKLYGDNGGVEGEKNLGRTARSANGQLCIKASANDRLCKKVDNKGDLDSELKPDIKDKVTDSRSLAEMIKKRRDPVMYKPKLDGSLFKKVDNKEDLDSELKREIEDKVTDSDMRKKVQEPVMYKPKLDRSLFKRSKLNSSLSKKADKSTEPIEENGGIEDKKILGRAAPSANDRLCKKATNKSDLDSEIKPDTKDKVTDSKSIAEMRMKMREPVMYKPKLDRSLFKQSELDRSFFDEGNKTTEPIEEKCICLRPLKMLLCECGNCFVGRLKTTCRVHPSDLYLLDVDQCKICKNFFPKEYDMTEEQSQENYRNPLII